MPLRNKNKQRYLLILTRASLLGALIVFCAGCQQGIIDARSLPLELQAPRLSNSQRVDLSRLARESENSELIYPGDVVEISVSTGLEEEPVVPSLVRVSNEGMVNVRPIGPVRIVGLRLTDAEREIRDESIRRGLFRDPSVTVVLDTRRSNQVTVIGAVEEPGVYELPSAGSHLLAALVAAGGPTEDADTIVEIKHPNSNRADEIVQTSYAPGGGRGLHGNNIKRRSLRIDLENPSVHHGDIRVEDGSVVMLMKQPVHTVQVIGLVNDPDQFEIPRNQDMRVLDAIALAGGRTIQLADKVLVTRQPPQGGNPTVISLSVKDAKRNASSNIRLAPGDVISVEETPTTFAIDTIRSFVRFGFSSTVPGF